MGKQYRSRLTSPTHIVCNSLHIVCNSLHIICNSMYTQPFLEADCRNFTFISQNFRNSIGDIMVDQFMFIHCE